MTDASPRGSTSFRPAQAAQESPEPQSGPSVVPARVKVLSWLRSQVVPASAPASRRYVVTRLDQPPLASAKAPADVRHVCLSLGLRPLDLHDFDRSSTLASLWAAARSALQLAAGAARLATARQVVVQYPLGRVNEVVLRRMKRAGWCVCLVHDLEVLRRPAEAQHEIRMLDKFDVVIVHSDAMADALRAHLPGKSVVVLDAFDFLTDAPALPRASSPSCLYVFGNLIPDKAGYLYELDTTGTEIHVEAYGPNCDTARLPEHVHWRGVLDPDRPSLDAVHGFGLVWDGDSASSLSGLSGQYLMYNAPHKFSLYLSLGIPVIVPTTAAVAPLVSHCGFGLCADSVEEALRKIEACTETEWRRMLDAVEDARRRVRSGEFLRDALGRAGIEDAPVLQRAGASN